MMWSDVLATRPTVIAYRILCSVRTSRIDPSVGAFVRKYDRSSIWPCGRAAREVVLKSLRLLLRRDSGRAVHLGGIDHRGSAVAYLTVCLLIFYISGSFGCASASTSPNRPSCPLDTSRNKLRRFLATCFASRQSEGRRRIPFAVF